MRRFVSTLAVCAFGLAAAVAIAAPVAAQQLVYNDAHTQTCLAAGTSPEAKKACIGVSANACMEDSAGGFSTLGMVGCLDREVQYWDRALNAAYKAKKARDQAEDAQNAADGITAPKKAIALRDMQRAWIAFRDASCLYERSNFGGGTGAGPAGVGCILQMTAEQAMVLQASDQVQ